MSLVVRTVRFRSNTYRVPTRYRAPRNQGNDTSVAVDQGRFDTGFDDSTPKTSRRMCSITCSVLFTSSP